MTPARLDFLANIVAGNAEAHARSMTGPHGESLQAAADAIRELSTALATAKDEERAAVVAWLRAEADGIRETPTAPVASVLRRYAAAIEAGGEE